MRKATSTSPPADEEASTESPRGEDRQRTGRQEEVPEEGLPQRGKSVGREYLEAILIAVIFAVFARTWVVQAFQIPTGSMEENLLVGDHILVNKFVYAPRVSELEERLLPHRRVRRGDVVVFKFPQDPARDFIKRCVGLPGDHIEIVDKGLRVNGERVPDASYTYHRDERIYPNSRFLVEGLRMRDNFGPYVVPDGHYFCLGDNRDDSHDSRFWGPVPADHLKGRALLVYWSFEAPPSPSEKGSLADRLRRLSRLFRRFFTHTRWERLFILVR